MDEFSEKIDVKKAQKKHSIGTFIEDTSLRLYHKKTCREIDKISPENIKIFHGNPESAGLLPCPKCCPDRAARFIGNPLYQQMARKKYSSLPKAEIMKSQIQDLCDLYCLFVEFKGPMAYITTIAGEWFFDIFSDPIQLHHKNENTKLKKEFRPKGSYHVQDIKISSPLMAIAYIYRHEQATIKRIMDTNDDLV